MARAVRVELPGAFYHVMARGDRREAIGRDDADRETFVRTLAEACERSGFRFMPSRRSATTTSFSWKLRKPICPRGWDAFTRRINTRHGGLRTTGLSGDQSDYGGRLTKGEIEYANGASGEPSSSGNALRMPFLRHLESVKKVGGCRG